MPGDEGASRAKLVKQLVGIPDVLRHLGRLGATLLNALLRAAAESIVLQRGNNVVRALDFA